MRLEIHREMSSHFSVYKLVTISQGAAPELCTVSEVNWDVRNELIFDYHRLHIYPYSMSLKPQS